ncbi:MAG: DNA gyrase inhibitor YacG [Rhodobacter sp. CACIA14H1]|nr:MAG: DNA gyrase inhibitor YacG [Rhodobacter sp. CACIA14H1]
MTCPVCGKEAEAKYRPFCSRRCADVDLGRWLTGGYAIPAGAAEDVDGDGHGDGDGEEKAPRPRPQ